MTPAATVPNAGVMSRWARSLPPNGMRELFDRARGISGVVNLALGQPHFEVPRPIAAAAVGAILGNHNDYPPTAGIPELRQAVRGHIQSTQVFDAATDDVIITSGVTGGLYLAFFGLLQAGDEILLPDPAFVQYPGLAAMTGATPVFYRMHPDFRLRVAELERVRTPRTKALLLNSPNNPTGAMFTEAELRAVADWARRHGLMVISDEIYELFAYDLPHISIKRHCPERTIIVGGFGKTYGMPGWRIGYACLPKFMLDMAVILQGYTYVCPPTPLQYGCVTAFGQDMRPIVADYKRKRDFVHARLSPHFPCTPPAGSIYIYPEIPRPWRANFMNLALERRLLVVPSTAFTPGGEPTHFRLCFAAPDETLEQGLQILESIARDGG